MKNPYTYWEVLCCVYGTGKDVLTWQFLVVYKELEIFQQYIFILEKLQ